MLVTHALNTLILLSGQRLAGGIQRAQRKHKAKCNPFVQCEIQPFQLTDRKQHNNDIIKNRQRSARYCENIEVNAFTMDR